MLPYFPFSDAPFKMTMGVKALDSHCLIEIDPDHYTNEITLKQSLLAEDYQRYYQGPAGTEPYQWEVLALLLPNMALHHPQHFQITTEGKRWTWQNRLSGEATCFLFGEPESLPYPPLDWLGRQIQEDLLILSGARVDGMPLIAGQLCFPNAWCLEDKLGKSFMGIHDEVPLFAEQIGRSSTLLLERLKVGRPTWRVNWSIKATPRLNHTPHFSAEARQSCLEMTPENVGERCLVRIERQTLSRLPETHGILFTIHTYQEYVASIASNPIQARQLRTMLQTTPAEMLEYKGISPFAEHLLTYLGSKAG